jgi:predicted nucleotidyltransferase
VPLFAAATITRMIVADDLQARAEKVGAALTSRLGINLHSCILYGSAVRGDASPKNSDINILIVLARATPEAHAAISDLLREYPRVEPFVLGLEGLPRSQQAFALKFRSIQRNHRILHGADILKDFKPDERILRFVCEQTLRNLRLRLTHQFIVNRRNSKRYTAYVSESLAGIFAGMSEALRCDNIELPRHRGERVPMLQQHFKVDASVLAELLDAKRSGEPLSEQQIESVHARLYQLLTAAVRWMETRWPTLL